MTNVEQIKNLQSEVEKLKSEILQWKERFHALQLACEVEREAADLYAKLVAHWKEEYDFLLAGHNLLKKHD